MSRSRAIVTICMLLMLTAAGCARERVAKSEGPLPLHNRTPALVTHAVRFEVRTHEDAPPESVFYIYFDGTHVPIEEAGLSGWSARYRAVHGVAFSRGGVGNMGDADWNMFTRWSIEDASSELPDEIWILVGKFRDPLLRISAGGMKHRRVDPSYPDVRLQIDLSQMENQEHVIVLLRRPREPSLGESAQP